MVVAGLSSGLTYHFTKDTTPSPPQVSPQAETRAEIVPPTSYPKDIVEPEVEPEGDLVTGPVFPEARLQPEQAEPEQVQPERVEPKTIARIAIIIDDLGNRISVADQILDLPAPVTLSILPYQRHSIEIARRSRSKDREVLLHLPMEPYRYPDQNPGEGTLLIQYPPNELKERTGRNLEAVPHIVGVNNHMGSKFTEQKGPMEIVMGEIKERNLFFVDSRTTSRTTGWEVARSAGVKVAERDVFLDNEPTEEYVENQMRILARKALKKGWAIGIGHPHQVTLSVIRKTIPDFTQQGIQIVPVSQLVN